MPSALAVALLSSLLLLAVPAGTAEDPPAKPAAVLCPVTGKPVDRNCVQRFRGKWVYFATPSARDQFANDPYEYADGVKAQWAADQPVRIQVKCPVTGKPVDTSIYAGEGLDAVYFASDDAKRKWLKDDQPFRKQLEKACYTFQTRCAHSNQVINPKVFRKIGERTIYFFCPNCAQAFDKESKAHQAELLKAVDRQIDRNKMAFAKMMIEKALAQRAAEQKDK
jgi:YHS domain-containing protein